MSIINKDSETIPKLIGKNIRLFRCGKGITLETLARELNVSVQQIQKYEKGINRISINRLLKISALLKVPIELFWKEDNATEETHNLIYNMKEEHFNLRILETFMQIPSKRQQKALYILIKTLIPQPTAIRE